MLSAPPSMPVHPRLCGEHMPKPPGNSMDAGSSPPVRGTRGAQNGTKTIKRFIPACAGNTKDWSDWDTVYTVHPRLCGEHAGCAATIWPSNGSSPPVRGTHPRLVALVAQGRFIPACAGNTRN